MEGFLTVKEVAQKWNVSERNVQSLCASGKVEGATKMSRVWIIPENSEIPRDGRVKSGKYKNVRKKSTT